MKKLLMLGLVLAAGLFSVPAKADVDVRIGIGVPGVVIGTNRHHPHYHPPVRHRHYGPPVYYYPEKVYRHPHRHYGGKHYRHYKHVRPPVHRHLRHGHRPAPPPHAYARGHWRR